jgi:hypothetical protein
MTHDRSLDVTPRREFADRLEADLLHIIGAGPVGDATHTEPGHTTALTSHKPIAHKEAIVAIELDHQPTARSPRRALVAAAGIILVVAAIALVAGRGNGDQHPAASTLAPGARNVTFVLTWSYDGKVHDCGLTANQPCMNHFAIPASSTLKGDIDGTAFQGRFWIDAAEYPGQHVHHLEHVAAYEVKGDVAGCGFGQFTIVETMQFRSGPNDDEDSGTYVGTWRIVDESGRLSLSSIAGSGTSSGSFSTAGTDGRTFTGTITCS